ncbi:hypothetical protein RHMOL_Rhmol04G0354700 [Rhododendron molle]|uniref:Uncharacterized protein n=1 Tax=Rhododendron molle TaxID=49168 RepID=A0ACC0P7N0_RHOML|nr:hypothetical protein RHMOL_Rhmol04G0354700 [Rhododendron molle]
MESTISLTNQEIVKEEPIKLFSPQNPTPEETIFLSNIDQAVIFPVETLFFFEVPPNKTPASTLPVFDLVRKAVAEVLLVPYYFMAGRLQFNQERNRLELLCNNGGVLFVCAESRLELKDLGNLSLPNSTFHLLIHRPGLYKSLADTPLFTIQAIPSTLEISRKAHRKLNDILVTRFKCGGFALGFMTNHGVLDGKSASEMFHNLASICRGEGLKSQITHNNRTSLRARNPPQIKFPHNEYVKLPKIPSLPTSFSSQNKTSPSPLIFSRKYYYKLFPFTQETICLLKEKAMVSCSSFEAIVAHTWKARAKAVFGQNPDGFSTVLFAVDIRGKISPNLPDGYVGNAVITAFATARVKDLEEKAFGYVVEKVKEGRDRVTDEYVRSVIDWLEVHRGVPATCDGNFYVSAWGKLGFGGLDFGLGKAVYGGPVVSGNDEFVLLLSDGSGGLNVWLGLEKEKMERFMVHVLEI